ncbi:jg27164 [Pararge aegeria aegeria]|uniref:Jg27164 protein n=1 Tax=Pararge aegeria aegeria TaxID=348720 RepID=A0A8S4R1P1_9NEOP|nr:jg27164 [Pararge aegeria aegeria]
MEKKPQPLAPGSPAIPASGSGFGNGGAKGVKNLRKRVCQTRRLDLAVYNARTLRTDEKLVELEEAVSKLRWSIMG